MNNWLRYFNLSCLLLINACSSLQMGKEHYNRGEYDAAKRTLIPLCEDNNYEAQFTCGQLALMDGDTTKAIDWFTRSANGQYSPSFWAVGTLAVALGRNDVAITWFDVGARWGEPNSIRSLQQLGQPVPEPDLLNQQEQRQAAQYQALAAQLNQINQQLAENRKRQEERNQEYKAGLQNQYNTSYYNRTSPYNPENSPYNPQNSVYNPNNSPYNPNNSPYNPRNSQYNPSNSIYNPDNSPYSPDNSKYNPKNSVYNPENSPYNANRNALFDSQGNSFGYFVSKQGGGFNLFNNSGEWIGYTTAEGRGVFSSTGENIGYLVPKSTGGYNLFLSH